MRSAVRLCSLLRGGGRPLATWPQLPRPVPAAVVAARASTAPLEEVEFDPAAGNSVSFIGSCIRIEQPRVFASGNSKLELAISVRNAGAPATAPLEERSLVWNVECWNELATQLHEHCRKGDRVLVTGAVKEDHWLDKTTQQPRKRLSIKAQKVAKVAANQDWKRSEEYADAPTGQGAAPRQPSYADPAAPSFRAAAAAAPASGSPAARKYPSASDAEAMWADVYHCPENWWDQRANNASSPGGKRPDFKHKTNEQALWLWNPTSSRTRGTVPDWVDDIMGVREQNPPPVWEPPREGEDGGVAGEKAKSF